MCESGDTRYCSYAKNHPVETATFIITSLATPGIIEYATLGGGATATTDAALWSLQKVAWKVGWKALQVCAGSSVCLKLAIKAGIYYPKSQGFQGLPTPTTLHPGQLISRFGDDTGSYASPIGTTLSQRALPFHQWNNPITGYEVLKPIDVLSSPAQPYYGLQGGGIQYWFSKPIQYYIENGYLSQPWP